MYNKFNLLRKYFTENYPQIPKEDLSDYVLTEILDVAKEELKANGKIVSDAEHCNIPLVSGSAFTKDDLRNAYNAGIDKGCDDIDKPTVNIVGAWSSGMFDDWFNTHYR